MRERPLLSKAAELTEQMSQKRNLQGKDQLDEEYDSDNGWSEQNF